MSDLDLEELESRLYGEVYHGIADETEQNSTTPIPTISLSKPTNDMRRTGTRYFAPWSPGIKFQNKNTPPKSNHSRPRLPLQRDVNNSDGFYSKDSGRLHKPDVPTNQVVVGSPKSIPVYISKKQARRAQWKANWKAKLLEKRKLKREQKRLRRQQRKQAELLKQADITVITLSDSDENGCVVVENRRSVILVGESDDEKKETFLEDNYLEEINENDITLKNESRHVVFEGQSDDVIFVEPAPIEVINLDEESVSHEVNVQNEAESFSSDSTLTNSPKKDKVKQVHQERKELLSTPDSASNDFMSGSSLELNKKKFNFSLHGCDFNSGEFLKPSARNESCETESSSSTTEANSVNLLKTVVFNEVDFPRDDIFSENNLESFGNFITPLRANSTTNVVQSSPIRTTEVHNQKKIQIEYSSDSSSESEPEETQMDKQKEIQKVRNLPELSPMQRNQNVAHVSKKSKKICSKYDLLDSGSSTSSTQDGKQKNAKKKKKNKKKKSNEGDNNVENTDSNIVENNLIEAESTTQTDKGELESYTRQKKRRSSHLEGSTTSESQPKKKSLLNAKEDILLQNSKSNEKTNTVECNELKNIESKDDEREKTKATNLSQMEKHKIDVEHPPSVDNGIQFDKKLTEFSRVQANSTFVSGKNKPTINETVNPIISENTFNENFSQVDNTFEGLIVIDEVNQENSIILSSDSESVLSALHEEQDIQINCKERKNVIEGNDKFDKFNVETLQVSMSNNPSLWKILETDKTPPSRSKGRRCNRCRQFGHMGIRCPNKIEVKCALCGGSGHYEPRCPNKICTQCGQRSLYSTSYCAACFKYRSHICQLCFVVGHHSDTCPDLWRRYHLTTSEGPLTKYEGPVLREKSKLWCSGCAQSGHLEHSCRFYKSIYPASDPFIKSYEDIYRGKEISPNIVFEPGPAFTQNNYAVDNNVGSNYYFEGMNEMNLMGYNYNQNNYGQMNNQFMKPYVDGIFVANQQNFYPPAHANMYQVPQIPQNNYPGNQNQIIFENPLPTYINFESQNTAPTYNQVSRAPAPDFDTENYFQAHIKTQSKTMRRHNSMFFSSSGLELQHFVNRELQRLSKLSLLSNKVLKEMRKRPVPRRDNHEKEEYYETLNMLLFGICNMSDGKMHLDRLKQFKVKRLTKVANGTRRRLYTSYCYIFGRDKHYGVDYTDLLRRI